VVTAEFINSLTEKQLRLFVDISIMADGTTSNYGTRTITQSIIDRLSPLQMACSLLGIRTTLKKRNTGGINNPYYGRPYWSLTLFQSTDSLSIGELVKRRPSVTKIIYHGLVWCPTTENGTWLARRKGNVYFTGNTNDPTVYTCSTRKTGKKRPELFIYNEWCELGVTNDVIAKTLMPIVGKDIIRCDSAEPKSIQELRQYGLSGAQAAIKGPGSINFGIQWLQQHDIVIHKSCQKTINDFTLYQWRKNKDGEVLNEPVDRDNDSIDSIRYEWSAVIFEELEEMKKMREAKNSRPITTKEEIGFW
jgi:hypothetical protein